MNNFIKINKEDWNDFLNWYEDYIWHSVPMADIIHVYDKNNKDLLIAYKYFPTDEYCVLKNCWSSYTWNQYLKDKEEIQNNDNL